MILVPFSISLLFFTNELNEVFWQFEQRQPLGFSPIVTFLCQHKTLQKKSLHLPTFQKSLIFFEEMSSMYEK